MMCDPRVTPGGEDNAQKTLPILLPSEESSPVGACVFSCSETLARSLINKDTAGLCAVFIKLNNYFHCIHSPRSSLWLAFHLHRNNRKLPSDVNTFRL